MSQEKYFSVLKSCRLFQNLSDEALQDALKYLCAEEHSYKKGEIILNIGQRIHYAGIVLEGEIECSFQDYDFNKYNMNHFYKGNLFAETMACLDVANSPMQIFVVNDCTILFLDLSVFSDSKTKFEYQTLLTKNLIHILAEQNFFLNQKVRLLAQKDLRSKILLYLKNLQADENGYRKLPFSKTALAEFLCVNRAALSREIHNMINDGLLKMKGRIFLIL
ncbi:MAG: Crp/Fnr family transcriptional regulator [Synergistaceae bacterium]|nr:Crp/Fnr family transcriptional regulator [Synergistaceae bacterium]